MGVNKNIFADKQKEIPEEFKDLAKDLAITSSGLKLASGMSKLIFSRSSSNTLEILLSDIETGVPLMVTDSFVKTSKQNPTFSSSDFNV